jgi:hypothetical protein
MFNHRRGGVGSFPTLTELLDLVSIGIGLVSGERSREGVWRSGMMSRP